MSYENSQPPRTWRKQSSTYYENVAIAPMLTVANTMKILYPRLDIIWGVTFVTTKSAEIREGNAVWNENCHMTYSTATEKRLLSRDRNVVCG